MLWHQFIACTAVILVSGIYLSQYGDIIAEKTGLGRTWIGVVLIASVASLPELITGISSVAVFDLPDIWDSLAILAVYVFAIFFLFTMR